MAVAYPSLLPVVFWGGFKIKLGQPALACIVKSVTGRVVLQSGTVAGCPRALVAL